MGDTSIQWTDKTWNPVTGCEKVSAGCKNCYAESVADRFFAKQYPPINGRPRKFTDVLTHPDRLDQPLHWRKPARIFVNSMSDLFHEDVPFEFVDKVFAVMALSPQHTFQILTKRPERMREYLNSVDLKRRIAKEANIFMRTHHGSTMEDALATVFMWSAHENAGPGEYANFLSNISDKHWPLPNVWTGVSVEDQKTADERIPLLPQTPAAVRFVSYEPALGPVNFNLRGYLRRSHDRMNNGVFTGCNSVYDGIGYKCETTSHWIPPLNWIIVGGESGPGARPFNIQWARDVIAQCKAAGVACFVKQLGANVIGEDEDWPQAWVGGKRAALYDRKGGNWNEWPEDLQVRQFPKEATR